MRLILVKNLYLLIVFIEILWYVINFVEAIGLGFTFVAIRVNSHADLATFGLLLKNVARFTEFTLFTHPITLSTANLQYTLPYLKHHYQHFDPTPPTPPHYHP